MRPLGYEITVGLRPNHEPKVPSGVTNVEAAVDFTFTLKDKDVFVLDTLSWKEKNGANAVSILAGQTRTFKGSQAKWCRWRMLGTWLLSTVK